MKSTVINNRLPFLFFDILLDHFVGDITRADGKIPTSPKVFASELLFRMWKFGRQHARAYSVHPLRDLADILGRVIGNEHMDMFAGYLTRNDFNLVLQCNLSQKVPSSNRNWSREHPFPVLGNPNQVDFHVRLCMSSELIKSHSGQFINFSSPEGEGFPPSPTGTLKELPRQYT